jgi:hypothetical protein
VTFAEPEFLLKRGKQGLLRPVTRTVLVFMPKLELEKMVETYATVPNRIYLD